MPPSKRTKRSMDSLATTAAVSSPSAAAAPRSSSSAKRTPPVSKRAVVKLAADADEVLAACHKLRDDLRRKAMRKSGDNNEGDSSDDEWGIEDDDSGDNDNKGGKKRGGKTPLSLMSSASVAAAFKTDMGDSKKFGAKTQQLSLSEIKSKTFAEGKTIVEVVEMNSTEVIEGIENVAVAVARQVLAKQGFQLDIPCK